MAKDKGSTRRRDERDGAAGEAPEVQIMRDAFDVGIRIHRDLGPGLYESVYEEIFCHEMAKLGYRLQRQLEVAIEWDGLKFDKAFRLDVLINDLVIIEFKAVTEMHRVFARQVLTYLKLTRKRLGAVMNFGLELFKEGFERVANGSPDSVAPSRSLRRRVLKFQKSNGVAPCAT
jgi:GxxExxY protein